MLVHEDRLVNTVSCGAVGIGERVVIKTRMGAYVTTGEVRGSSPFGLSVREGDDENKVDKFYHEQFYLFSVHEPEQPTVAARVLTDMTGLSPDERVEQKLRVIEGGEVTEGGEPEPKGGARRPVEPQGAQGGAGTEPDDKEGGTGQGKEKPKRAVAEPQSNVDVSKLPSDIQKAIISTDELDEDQLNMVLGQISDTATKSLKRANIKETELYGIVEKIQDAVYGVLTGKPLKKKK